MEGFAFAACGIALSSVAMCVQVQVGYEIHHDHYPGLGILIADLHGVKNRLSVKKITTTQSDPSTHFDLFHAYPFTLRPKRPPQALWRGEE